MMKNVTKAIVILLMVLLVMGIVLLFIEDKKPQKITTDKNNTSESIKEAADKTETLNETNDAIDTPVLLDIETNSEIPKTVNSAGKESGSVNNIVLETAGSETADQSKDDKEDTDPGTLVPPENSQESNTDNDTEETELPDLPAAGEVNDNLGVNELPFDKLD